MFGIHWASCWSSSVSLSKSSSKFITPSFRFFPECKIPYGFGWQLEPGERYNHDAAFLAIPSSISFWRSDGSILPFILLATIFRSPRRRSTSCYLWVSISYNWEETNFILFKCSINAQYIPICYNITSNRKSLYNIAGIKSHTVYKEFRVIFHSCTVRSHWLQ